MNPTPLIAIIGRPNVGKSTLFNRLVGKKIALVDDQPGVTRDRRYAKASLAGLDFTLIDTAGIEEGAVSALNQRMIGQTKAAIAEADAILFMVDARTGITPTDQSFARLLHQSGKKIVLVANKAEGKRAADVMSDLYALGFSSVALISAEHGEGMGDLFEALSGIGDWGLGIGQKETVVRKKRKKKAVEIEEEDLTQPPIPNPESPLKITILGRPNAGKSTLANALLKEDRLLTGPEAGITRDAIAVTFDYHGTPVEIVDTAGMRKRANVQGKVEHLAVADSIRAMQFAEVVIMLIDATAPLEKQDAAIAALVEREGRACVIGINKWDLIKGDKNAWLHEFRLDLNKQLFQLAGIAVVPISASRGTGLEALIEAAIATRDTWSTRLSTSELNNWLETMLAAHTPPMVRGRRLKIKYMTQVKTRPPTFHLFCNMAKEFPDAYLRYLVAGLRKRFHLDGVPIRTVLKASNNPFDKRKKK